MRFEFPCPASGVPLHLANSWFWHLLFLRQAGPDWIAFPKTTSKIGCFVYSACWEFPAWRLNSALPGVKQRRQDVREFPTCRVSETAQFFHRFLEKQSNRALPAVKIRGARTTSWPDAKEPRRPGRNGTQKKAGIRTAHPSPAWAAVRSLPETPCPSLEPMACFLRGL